ncbi:alkane 1-monooxygenase [Cohnella sp. CIP 111063]|uniref:LLM class flavin-dependent oxidoreductase n=1 Tax=unclassified Cohnella TaxID=2636738 RepID=UPI000B8C4D71|nr:MULTISPECIES: LLM class flavin-dependent oxidoreductase [unclassified Cohnella]OXS61814.1 alkane 1-monooxygenase [Cohnella sp. CIP 111063]PRX74256.1 luciferase family oxidoreductase group 1 [Cohnella sp. SGD-V74]
MGIRLSILDQTLINKGEDPTEAFEHTVELARKAEAWGYYRFWVSEHHDSDLVAGSSPEVLIAHLLAKTERIRVGSGGVMLQHYSPYKVAENFNVLASLNPGRVDLGIGRAPGGLPHSIRALQAGKADQATLPEKIAEVLAYTRDRLPLDHPLAGLKASPVPRVPADVLLLGASASSAATAAELGLPYVYALFINNDEEEAARAFEAYRSVFRSAEGRGPEALLAVPVIVADTDEEARSIAEQCRIVKIHLKSGRTITVATVEHAEEYGRQAEEEYTIDARQAYVVHGSKETVRAQLLEAAAKYGVEEFIVISTIRDAAKRLRSYELLKEAFAETPVAGKAVQTP